MVNQSFTQLSGIERQEKLQAALQCMTDNALTDTELTAISRAVRLDRQYFIRVHHTFEAFLSDLMHPAQCQTRFFIGSRPVFQQNLKAMLRYAVKTGDPAHSSGLSHQGKNGIYILTRNNKMRKEQHHDKQRLETPHGL